MTPSSLSFRTRLTALIFVLTLTPLAGATVYFLDLYRQDKLASLFETELSNTTQGANRLENSLTSARILDTEGLADSRNIIVTFENPCVPYAEQIQKKPLISKHFLALFKKIPLDHSKWISNPMVAQGCARNGVQVITGGPGLPFPILQALLPAAGNIPQRLVVLSLDGLGGASANSNFFLVDAPAQKILWSNPATNSSIRDISPEAQKLIKDTLSSGVSSITRTGDGRITAAAQVTSQWILLSSTSEAEAMLPLKFFLTQTLWMAAGCIFLYLLLGKLSAASIAAPLGHLRDAAEKLGAGDLSIRIPVHGRDEISIVQATFNGMADRLVQLIEMTKRQAAMESDLAIAQKVQKWFFPEKRNQVSGHEIHGSIEMAANCGGDWWTYVEIPQPAGNSLIVVMLGDAAGHGISSALITAAVQGAFTILELIFRTNPQDAADPRNALRLLNRVIHRASGGEVHMSFVVAVLDPAKEELRAANAGHNPPYWLNAEATEIKPLMSSSTVLGTDLEAQFDSLLTLPWKPGCQLFLYTDGLTDCKSPDGKDLFNKRALQLHLQKSSRIKGEALLREVLKNRKNMIGNLPQADDVTAIVCTRTGSGATTVTPSTPPSTPPAKPPMTPPTPPSGAPHA